MKEKDKKINLLLATNIIIIFILLSIIIFGASYLLKNNERKNIRYGLCIKECADLYPWLSKERENCSLKCLDIYNIDSEEYLEWWKKHPEYHEMLEPEDFYWKK